MCLIRQDPTLYYYFLTVNDCYSSLFILSDRTPPLFYMHGSIDIFILVDLIKKKIGNNEQRINTIP